MLMVSSLELVSLAGSTNGRVGLSPEFLSDGWRSRPFVRFLFNIFDLVLVLKFILPVKKWTVNNITVPQLVGCSGMG